MKNIILTIATLFTLNLGNAQMSSFTGNITDEFGMPIQNAYILVLNASDLSYVKGAISDENGIYFLEGIIEGDYVISVDHVSLQEPIDFPKVITVEGNQIFPGNKTADLTFDVYSETKEIDCKLYSNGSQFTMTVLGYEKLVIN